MPKKSNTANKAKRAKAAVKVRKPRMVVPRGLGSAASSHLAQIVDPCNAPLGETIYNSLAALRTRFRANWVPTALPATSAIGGFAIAYHPVIGFLNSGMVDADTDTNFYTADSGWPGYARITDTPARGVGGCVSMTWNGNELDRRGLIYTGIVNGGMIQEFLLGAEGGDQTVFTLNNLVTKLPGYCRVPNDKCEVTWVPTEADSEFMTRPSKATGSVQTWKTLLTRVNFVVMVYMTTHGISEVPKISVANTSIVEYMPEGLTDQTIVDAAHVAPTAPRGKVTDLVRVVQSRDPAWYFDTFKKVGKLLGKGVAAYASGGVLGLVTEVAKMAIAPRKNFAS